MSRNLDERDAIAGVAAVRAAIARMGADDPRRALPDGVELALAEGDAMDPRRWHEDGADWEAAKLQYGRGASVADLARRFSIAETTIRRRRDKEEWSSRIGAAEARGLSRRVWFAGLARYAHDPAAIAALAEASAWSIAPCLPPGAQASQQIQEARRDDAGQAGDDPWHDERVRISGRLETLIAQLERDLERDLGQLLERDRAPAEAAGDGEVAEGMDMDTGRAAPESGARGEGMAGLGEPGAASA